jgi:hypothetical protein
MGGARFSRSVVGNMRASIRAGGNTEYSSQPQLQHLGDKFYKLPVMEWGTIFDASAPKFFS